MDATFLDSIMTTLDKEDLVDDKPQASSQPPIVTQAMVLQAVGLLKDPEENGGDLGIARQVGCTLSDVRAIKRAVSKRLAEIAEADLEPAEL